MGRCTGPSSGSYGRFGPVPALLLFLNYPLIEAARQQAEADQAIAIAVENEDFCTKWGMVPGSAEHASCIRDLVGIRARTEQLVRDKIADYSDF